MLYESLNYAHESDKRTCFQHMQELIDQIYGVDTEVIANAEERFTLSATAPKHFELVAQLNKLTRKKDRVKYSLMSV